MLVHINRTSMPQNANNIFCLNYTVLVSRITGKYFKHATEIRSDMSVEDQILTKHHFQQY